LIRVIINGFDLQLFEFGDKYRGKYDESIGVAKGYYSSVSGYMDELLWAALWLYKATDKEDYLRYMLEKANLFGGITWAMTEFSWDVKYVGVQIIASKVKPSLSLSLLETVTLSRNLCKSHTTLTVIILTSLT
jgi:hypothetical protein